MRLHFSRSSDATCVAGVPAERSSSTVTVVSDDQTKNTVSTRRPQTIRMFNVQCVAVRVFEECLFSIQFVEPSACLSNVAFGFGHTRDRYRRSFIFQPSQGSVDETDVRMTVMPADLAGSTRARTTAGPELPLDSCPKNGSCRTPSDI